MSETIMRVPDTRAFRNALGRFATGVTVVTAQGCDGAPVGVTASSFNSVSLDPPMVLWSLSRSSRSLPAFEQGGEFAIHVLGAHQEDLSARFASRGSDKFAGLEWSRSPGGAPLLPNCAARFLCRTAYQYEGGDHIIFVGEVIDYEHAEKPPLLFHAGSYFETTDRVREPQRSGIDNELARVTEDYLAFLVTRAYFQLTRCFAELGDELDLTRREQRALVVIGAFGHLSLEELQQRLEFTHSPPQADLIDHLVERGFVFWISEREIALTAEGSQIFLRFLSLGKDEEDTVLEQLTPREVIDLRRLLKRLVRVTGPNVPPTY